MDETTTTSSRGATGQPPPPAPPRAGRKEWIGLVALVLPALIVGMDLTVLHLAVPAISRDLGPTGDQLLWIIDVYGFLIAGSLITMGKLGDRIGRRRLLLIGAAAFGVASVVAAYATGPVYLIVARAVLGIAGATLAPSTLSLIRNMFHDPGQRTRAISVWFMAIMTGNAIGPLVGGVLLEHFWWGSAFLLAVPAMVLLLVAGPILLPEYRDPQPGKLDLFSAVLSLCTVLPVIYGIQRIANGGSATVAVPAIVVGILIGVVFAHRQTRIADPLLDLGLLRNRAFAVSVGTLTLASLLTNGTGYFGMQFLQLVLGRSTLESGLLSLPLLVAGIVGTMITPTLARHVRPGFVVAGGLVIGAAGFAMLALVGPGSGVALLILGFVVIFFGLSPTSTLGVELMVGAAPPERAGGASAMSETCQQFGGALGLAVFGSIGTAVYRASLGHSLPVGLAPEAVGQARNSLGGAVTVAGRLPGPLGADLLNVARSAFADGLNLAATVTGAIALVVAVAAGILLRQVRRNNAAQ